MNKKILTEDTSKGITLISLAVTIILLLILASVTTYTGISTIKSSKLTKFTQELEIMQAEVNLLYEKYKEDIKNDIEIKIGKKIPDSLTTKEQTKANVAFTACQVTDKAVQAQYRLFDEQTIKDLKVEGIEREYLVNIKERKVICLEGFETDDATYYRLEQVSEKNYVDGTNFINDEEVSFKLAYEKYLDRWKINITELNFSKYVGKGKIQYKKTDSDEWITVEQDALKQDYNFAVKEEGTYQVKVTDAAGKVKEDNITIRSIVDE